MTRTEMQKMARAAIVEGAQRLGRQAMDPQTSRTNRATAVKMLNQISDHLEPKPKARS